MANQKDSTHVGLMRPGAKVTYHRISDGRSPWVAPPPGLVVAQVLLLGWLAIELAVVLLDQNLSETLENSATAMIAAVCFGALGPILISYGISTNRAWARHLLFVSVSGIGVLLWFYFGVGRSSEIIQGITWLISGLGLLLLVWYLYFSNSVRAYYGAIKGEVLPTESTVNAAPEKVERSTVSGSHLQSALEYAVIFVGLAVFVAAYFMS